LRGRELIRASVKIEKLSRGTSRKEREGFLRRAISGIYYGTLWEVLEFLETKGTKINRDYKVHSTVRESLKAKGYTKASVYLKQLHDLRKLADYEYHLEVDYSKYVSALTLAKLILKEVGR